MDPLKSTAEDPLDDPKVPFDAYHGAVLLSDQIEYYTQELDPPLLANPDGSLLDFTDRDGDDWACLDTASYKLRLGDEAHVGGKYVRVSKESSLELDPHQVAVVKTYEKVNIPRYLVGRWNIRVKWVYEGLLWVGGPQVDPGWRGHLYCPIYNLAERKVVIPFKERVFTIDFTRTTPFQEQESTQGQESTQEQESTYGFRTKPHQPARKKTLGDHDVHQIRSSPYEKLSDLASLNEFKNLAFTMLAVVFTAVGAITAALAVVAMRPVTPSGEDAQLLSGWPLTAVSLSIFASILSSLTIVVYCCSKIASFFRWFKK